MAAATTDSGSASSSPASLGELYELMALIRAFETRVAELYRDGEIPGFVHTSLGQEAVAAGVGAALREDDYIATTHRGHGHCIAKGVDVDGMMGELFAKVTGLCRGKGGSMHVSDPRRGVLCANAIVGASMPLAVGAALASKLRGQGRVAIAYFGEGAVNQGAFHEALNLAAVWDLPLLLVCENNGYAELTPVALHLRAKVHELAAPHGIPGVQVDGNDALAVRAATETAVARARAGDGPSLLECATYRWSGHYVGDPERYRAAEEVAAWRERDPIPRLAALLGEARAAAIDAEVAADLDAAAARALAAPLTVPDALLEHVWS